MNDNINYDRLRADLISNIGPAMPIEEMAEAEVVFLETCSNAELEDYAIRNDVDLDNYHIFTR